MRVALRRPPVRTTLSSCFWPPMAQRSVAGAAAEGVSVGSQGRGMGSLYEWDVYRAVLDLEGRSHKPESSFTSLQA